MTGVAVRFDAFPFRFKVLPAATGVLAASGDD
jgi:hypothetical protein